jgi:hypothetical protein
MMIARKPPRCNPTEKSKRKAEKSESRRLRESIHSEINEVMSVMQSERAVKAATQE